MRARAGEGEGLGRGLHTVHTGPPHLAHHEPCCVLDVAAAVVHLHDVLGDVGQHQVPLLRAAPAHGSGESFFFKDWHILLYKDK